MDAGHLSRLISTFLRGSDRSHNQIPFKISNSLKRCCFWWPRCSITHPAGGQSWRRGNRTSGTAASQSHPPPPGRSHTGWGPSLLQRCIQPLKRQTRRRYLALSSPFYLLTLPFPHRCEHNGNQSDANVIFR